MKTKYQILLVLVIVCFSLSGVATALEENDLDTDPSLAFAEQPPQPFMLVGPMAATFDGSVDNGDGTFTFTQIVDKNSTPPHYVKPLGFGFEEYSWGYEDYGWAHTFPNFADPGITINSVKLIIRAWDVDSPKEFDNITADGFAIVPLQGSDMVWSVTEFDIDPSLLGDGRMNVFLDIDTTHGEDKCWAVKLDYSKLIVDYSVNKEVIPEFPTVALPVTVIIGLVFFLQRRKD